jgi:GTPase SAR1 family protein
MSMLINISRGFEFAVPVTPESRRSLREAQGIFDEVTNIALVGQVSAGKTSFINSCRGLFPRFKVEYHFANPEFGLGPVGNREVTQEIQKYRSTRSPNTLWWDMPGIGGSGGGWKSMKYYITFNLVLYDLIILLHSGSFGQVRSVY